jgi:translation initiation factor 2 gamma subunit (eIF-2gamma)
MFPDHTTFAVGTYTTHSAVGRRETKMAEKTRRIQYRDTNSPGHAAMCHDMPEHATRMDDVAHPQAAAHTTPRPSTHSRRPSTHTRTR